MTKSPDICKRPLGDKIVLGWEALNDKNEVSLARGRLRLQLLLQTALLGRDRSTSPTEPLALGGDKAIPERTAPDTYTGTHKAPGSEWNPGQDAVPSGASPPTL